MTILTLDQINNVWLLLFAGVTASSPIVVALITKKWGRSVGRNSATSHASEDLWREHQEHDQTRDLIKETNVELKSRLDRIYDLTLLSRNGDRP